MYKPNELTAPLFNATDQYNQETFVMRAIVRRLREIVPFAREVEEKQLTSAAGIRDIYQATKDEIESLLLGVLRWTRLKYGIYRISREKDILVARCETELEAHMQCHALNAAAKSQSNEAGNIYYYKKI